MSTQFVKSLLSGVNPGPISPKALVLPTTSPTTAPTVQVGGSSGGGNDNTLFTPISGGEIAIIVVVTVVGAAILIAIAVFLALKYGHSHDKKDNFEPVPKSVEVIIPDNNNNAV